MKKILLAGVAGVALMSGLSAAQAGGFALREQGAKGLGQAYAGSAAGAGGLSSMFWNPATITQREGWNSQWNIHGIIPYAKITPTAGPTAALGAGGDIGQDAILPATYQSYQWNNQLWIGLQVNTPYGLVTQNPSTWAGQVYGRTSKVASMEISPTIGFKFNDMVSVGASLRVMQFKTRLTSALAAAPNAPGAELKGDGWAVGWSAGVNFTPFAGTDIGIGYRSQMRPELSGNLLTPAGATAIKTTVDLPDQITVGLRQRVNDRFTLLAGFEWTHWKVLDRFPVIAKANGATATTLSFDYENAWYASVGGEYRWNENLTVRAGLGYERSPISDAVRTVRLPDSDRIWASLGASWQVNQKLSVDVSYAHLFAKSGSINYNAAHPDFKGLPLQASTKAHVDIVAVGINYRWDNPKVVQGNLPLVRKY